MRTSRLLAILPLLALLPVPFPAPGNAPAPSPAPPAEGQAAETTGPVMQALMRDLDQLEEKMLGLADAIPTSSYDWRPDDGVRSVSEVLMHVAADNWFIPTAAGVAAPAATGITPDSYASVQSYERRSVTPAEAIAEMRASFAHLDRVMAGVDEARLTEPQELFGQEMTALELWVLTTTHLHEHLGQLIAYARTNGVVPPWSG